LDANKAASKYLPQELLKVKSEQTKVKLVSPEKKAAAVPVKISKAADSLSSFTSEDEGKQGEQFYTQTQRSEVDN
jgi:hypothetical protein